MTAVADLKKFVRDIPDFPKPGVVFKDITPLLASGAAFHETVELLAEAGRKAQAGAVVAIESRGFIFGSAVAQVLGVGVVPVRKKGKLPYKTISASYELEYGKDTLEMHADGLAPGSRAVIIDDVLATGGTAEAVRRLIEESGALAVAAAFVIELEFLGGRRRIKDLPVVSLIKY